MDGWRGGATPKITKRSLNYCKEVNATIALLNHGSSRKVVNVSDKSEKTGQREYYSLPRFKGTRVTDTAPL